jgi:hypothetical protein
LWSRLAHVGFFPLQAKLRVGAVDDPLEREADRVAEAVVSGTAQVAVQRKCAACEEDQEVRRSPLELPAENEEETLQTKRAVGAAAKTAPEVSSKTASRITSLRGGGEPLPTAARSYFEPRFGRDLSAVRLHTGATAAAAAREVGARAFAVGSDVAFGAGEYRPESSAGRKLLAHELSHVVQQAGSSAAGGQPAWIQRSPEGSEEIHQGLIEQYRRAHGLPANGIDPHTGQTVGPTDAEIRFGGLLESWLRAQPGGAQGPSQTLGGPGTPPAGQGSPPGPTPVRGVPAPARAPSIAPPGSTNVVAACASATDVGACRGHQNYVRNFLPQAIANIRGVASPYSAAIAAMYGSALAAAQAAPAPIPAGTPGHRFGRSEDALGGGVTVTFGGTTHTFSQFTITLQQFRNGANGQAFGAGGAVAFIMLNEISRDVLTGNLAGVEETMVHEAIHVLMEIVEAGNQARAAGAAPVDPNLDRASYATVQAGLERAMLPFVTQIRQLPSFASQPPRLTGQQDAASTARSFLSEAIARAEAAIFVRQRAGQAFTAADLSSLPPFTRAADYWSPTPPVIGELTAFLQANASQIDTAVQPLIVQAGERYLALRP